MALSGSQRFVKRMVIITMSFSMAVKSSQRQLADHYSQQRGFTTKLLRFGYFDVGKERLRVTPTVDSKAQARCDHEHHQGNQELVEREATFRVSAWPHRSNWR